MLKQIVFLLKLGECKGGKKVIVNICFHLKICFGCSFATHRPDSLCQLIGNKRLHEVSPDSPPSYM